PRLVRLAAGQSLHDNVNFATATSGRPFTEPGRYEITPTLILPAGDPGNPGRAVRVTGRPLRLRITDAVDPTTDDILGTRAAAQVAAGIAVGSFRASGADADAVEELRSRFTGTGAGSPIHPGIAAV